MSAFETLRRTRAGAIEISLFPTEKPRRDLSADRRGREVHRVTERRRPAIVRLGSCTGNRRNSSRRSVVARPINGDIASATVALSATATKTDGRTPRRPVLRTGTYIVRRGFESIEFPARPSKTKKKQNKNTNTAVVGGQVTSAVNRVPVRSALVRPVGYIRPSRGNGTPTDFLPE